MSVIIYMSKMKRKNHPLHVLLPKSADKNCNCELRDSTKDVFLYQDFNFCRNNKTETFFTFGPAVIGDYAVADSLPLCIMYKAN
jgi:hypothetical protein